MNVGFTLIHICHIWQLNAHLYFHRRAKRWVYNVYAYSIHSVGWYFRFFIRVCWNKPTWYAPVCIAFLGHERNSLHWRHNELDGVPDHQPHDCLLTCLFRHRSIKKTPKLRVTGLCEVNSPGTGEFPAQKPSNAENVSIWWRHHVLGNMSQYPLLLFHLPFTIIITLPHNSPTMTIHGTYTQHSTLWFPCR